MVCMVSLTGKEAGAGATHVASVDDAKSAGSGSLASESALGDLVSLGERGLGFDPLYEFVECQLAVAALKKRSETHVADLPRPTESESEKEGTRSQ